MKILSPSQMRNLEGAAEREGLSPLFLMQEAASSAYCFIRKKYPRIASPVLIVCGKGNNGGDGLALAALLRHGAEVWLPVGEPAEGTLGAHHLARCREMGLPLYGSDWLPGHSPKSFALLVDALLGTGLNRPVEGTLLETIDTINSLPLPVVSLDIPSGVNGLTGAIEGSAVRADDTVTFGLPKGGNLLFPGNEQGGRLHLSHIRIPAGLREEGESLFRISEPCRLNRRNPDMHKSTQGRLVVVGGSLNYGGAPRFAAQAFMRSGGGYVHMVVPETLVIPLAIGFPEAVLHPQKTEDGFLEMAHLDEIEKLAAGKGSLVIGPGLGLRSETGDFVRELIHGTDIPVIIDGDGLTHLAGHASLLRGREAFLTPHPGEASRLLGISVAEVEQDRPAAVRRLADLYHARVVLKGAHSLITGPGEEIYMNLSGSTALATAGSGDILGGIVASLLGGGLKGTDALRTAVFIHGLAGEAAGRKLGEDGVTASDILACLPQAVNDYRMNFETYRSGLTGKIGTIP